MFPTREAIRSAQLEQLRRLYAAILPANRFYAAKLKSAAITSVEEFAQRVPFTTKQELVDDQRAHPPYGTNLSFPLETYTRFHQTSGTTGTPLRWLDTSHSWQWMLDSWKEIFRAANVHAGDRVYFSFSFGPFIGFWLAYEAAQQLGCMCIPGGGLSTEARLRAIFDNDVTVLCCTPTYAIRLAEVAIQNKLDLSKAKVKTILVAGEPGGSIPATRARLEKLWPTARISDHHGMTETGPVTFECPSRPGYLHIIESAYIAEIVKPGTNDPVSPGTSGELILTTLGRTGSPLLRYRTGDLVKAVAQDVCVCGRHELTLDGGILGRTDDMVIVRGVNIYPSAIEDVLRTFAEIAEYRVQLKQPGGLAELSLELEPTPQCAQPAEMAKSVEAALHNTFNLRIPIKLAAAGALPRFDMKAKRWVKV